MNLIPFSNPWKDLPKEDLLKTTVDVSRSLISDINRVHSKQGVLQTTIYILLTKLVDELKRNDITEYDPAAYELGLRGCTITFNLPQRSATDVPATGQQPDGTTQTTGGDVGHGSNGLAQSNEGPPAAPSVDCTPKRARKRRISAKGEKGITSEQPK